MDLQRMFTRLRRLNVNGKGTLKAIWKDERGFWSLAFGIFLLIMAIPFVFFVMELGTARYGRNVAYTSVDAASLSGALQYNQEVTSTNSYGEPVSWRFVVDQPRAETHAENLLLQNINNYSSRGITLQNYNISFPDDEHCRVDATVSVDLPRLTQVTRIFLQSSNTYRATIRVHATAGVVQPVPSP